MGCSSAAAHMRTARRGAMRAAHIWSAVRMHPALPIVAYSANSSWRIRHERRLWLNKLRDINDFAWEGSHKKPNKL